MFVPFQIKPEIVPQGGKIIKLTACGVTVIDSHCFIPMPLSQLPKAFGLQELKKGYFPYLFYPPEGLDYIGPWPPSDTYDPNHMKNRAGFDEWYQQQRDQQFNFKEELLSYCHSDVDILR